MLNVQDENLLQVRLNRRERFRLMRQHHPQGEAPDGPRHILHDPPNSEKSALRALFSFLHISLPRLPAKLQLQLQLQLQLHSTTVVHLVAAQFIAR